MAMHEGHRRRKKQQFLTCGLDAFADHEVLELLLYYAIPRADTNPAAHRLLERFGSLEGVLSAPCEELCAVEGIGENAAVLISLLLPLYRRMRSGGRKKDVILNAPERVGAFFLELFRGAGEEIFYQADLDAKGKLLRCRTAAEGGADAVNINVRRIVEAALRDRASNVILAHNHPSGIALPSEDDRTTTLAVRDALRSVGIELVDHIIVADGDYVSLRDDLLL